MHLEDGELTVDSKEEPAEGDEATEQYEAEVEEAEEEAGVEEAEVEEPKRQGRKQ